MRRSFSFKALLSLKYALLAVAALLLIGAACSPGPPAQAAAGDRAPDFTLSTVAGQMASLNQAQGQVAVVVFWRTD